MWMGVDDIESKGKIDVPGKIENTTQSTIIQRLSSALNNQYGVLPEVFEEMKQIKKEAIEGGYFLQAPNGKPSNLDEKLWLLVRTKNFKKWFGDWEQTARFSSTGFEMLIGIPGSGKSTYLRTLNNSNISIVSPDNIRRELTGNISDQTKDEDVWTEVEKRINELLSQGKYVILDATNVTTEYRVPLLNKIKDNNNNINCYATLFDISPEESKRRIEKDIEDKIDRSNVPDDIIDMMYDLYQETLKSLPSEGFSGIYEQNDINSISKIVDENGEPLVVYHGTDIEINVFDLSKNVANVSWFTTDKEYAAYHTKKRDSNIVGSFFLNIRSPYGNLNETDALDDLHTQMIHIYKSSADRQGIKPDGYIGHDTFLETKRSNGYEIAATNPNQIKSIDNYGYFSEGNNNIKY